MKDNLQNKKEAIIGSRANRESLYYTILFTLGAIAAAVLICLGSAKANKGLTNYAAVLLPIFVIAALVFARFSYVSANTVHKNNGVLVIKTFFITRKYNVSEIEKFALMQSKNGEITEVKIIYREKTFYHTFKKMTKEEAARLKRVAHNK